MNTKAVVMAIITVVVWGSGFAAIRAGLIGGYSAGHFVLVRYAIASAFFLIYALWPGVKFRLPKKEDAARIALLGVIGISIYHIGVTFGELTVSSATAGMLIGASPVFIAIIAMIVLKERLGVLGWIGLIVGFTGIVLITLGTSDGSTWHITEGTIYILIAAIATSIMFVYQKPLLQRYHPIEITAYFTWAGTIPFLFFTPGLFQELPQATLEAHLAVIYAGIFPAAIAYVTWAIALSIGNASTISSFLYAEPVVAIAVAWVWLQEWPSTLSLIGGIVAIAGVLIVNVRGQKSKGAKLQP